MIVIASHIVPEEHEEIRIYDYAQQIFPTIPSRKAVKKAISRGEITVNGEKTTTGWWIKSGQKIEWLESTVNPPKAYQLELEVVYEDEYLAIIHKPAGITVSGNQYRTIQNALIDNLKTSNEEDALRWPKPVHRLDYATSGLLIIAKTGKALVKLGQQFQNKEIQKTYAAIVIGKIQENGTINEAIEGLPSSTKYSLKLVVPSLRSEHLSLLELYPKTGRTHQLRIHLSQLGFPILGDKIYGNEGAIFKGKGLFLAAIGLAFHHPITEVPLSINIPIPEKFEALLEREERRWNKYH